MALCFRPLAGISCVSVGNFLKARLSQFPSPRGDKLCPVFSVFKYRHARSFRPLAGISCVISLKLTFGQGKIVSVPSRG